MLRPADEGYLVAMVDQRGHDFAPDFRRHEGYLREVIREYEAGRRRGADLLSWKASGAAGEVGFEPSPRLIELALEAGILVDEDQGPLSAAPGLSRVVLRIEEDGHGRFRVRALPLSVAEDGETAAADPGDCAALDPRHVLLGTLVYEVADLGPEWRSLGDANALVKAQDLALHLSTQVSRFPGVEPSRRGFTVSRGGARIVRPALLFREIDAYGYLHVRPFGFIEGFPPGFLEDQEVSRIVEIDDTALSLAVADLVYPRFADEEFRRILAASGRRAKAAVFEEAGRFVIESEFVGPFLVATMRELMANFALFEAEKLARYKVVTARPKLRFHFSSGIDFLGGDAELEIAGQFLPYDAFLQEYEREGCVTLSDGSRAFPDSRDIERYQRLLRRVSGTGRGKGAKGGLYQVSDIDLPALEREADLENEGERWARARDFYHGFNQLAHDDGDEPGIAGGELRPYQSYGARWIQWLARHGKQGCLADEMGLGKTIQTIAALRAWRSGAEPGEGPILIVMPRSLLFNWKGELARFAPELSVLVHHGSERGEEFPKGELGSGLVILTSYATLRNDIELFRGTEFSWIILDESQSIKNFGTQTHAAVTALRGKRRLALSGTPVENHIGELWSLFDFLDPGFFGEASDFARRWKGPIEGGDEDALRDLKARLYPFILRRRKAEVLPELPPRTEQTSYVELESEHMALYQRRRLELKAKVDRAIAEGGFAKSGFLILSAMTELRRLASVPEALGDWQGVSAKRLFLRESIADLVESGHKALVFTNWLASVELISEDLAALGIGNLVMTGASSDRASLVERFQSDASVSVFTMTLKTGGLGLNLTAADYVFLLDPWWNRAAEAQAIDRTHRIGQVNPVFCYRLIAKDTIEERLLELQERKAGLVASLLAADTEAVKALDADDIAFLLG